MGLAVAGKAEPFRTSGRQAAGRLWILDCGFGIWDLGWRVSRILESARVRLAAVKSIDPNLDLGNGVTAADFDAKIGVADESLGGYNTALSLIDECAIAFDRLEDAVNDHHERVLPGVDSKFGRDSVEYEKAGGTRKSEGRRIRTAIPTPLPVG